MNLRGLLVGSIALCSVCTAHAEMVETAPGVSIYVERVGTGPQVVLIPARLFNPDFAKLARADRTLVLYDMRDRGRSSRVDDKLTIEDDVADLEALRKHVGAERVSLVGWSYLGLMTALYATEYPDRVERLVQIGPMSRKLGTAYPVDQRADESSLDDEGRAALQRWTAARKQATEATDQHELCRVELAFMRYWLVGNPRNAARVADTCIYENEYPAKRQAHFAALFRHLGAQDYPRQRFILTDMPVLVLHGTLDRNVPWGSGLEWASLWRNGRLITVEGGAHDLWLDDANFYRDVDRFLAGTWPARAQKFGRDEPGVQRSGVLPRQ